MNFDPPAAANVPATTAFGTPARASLTLEQVAKALKQDGHITDGQMQELLAVTAASGTPRHPLATVSERRLVSAREPGALLDLEWLTRWMARRSNLEYVRIDPLKVDVMSVTRLISFAYANRFRILPLAVDERTVTIASGEPYATDWINELEPLLKLEIRHVLASPIAVSRYLSDFYSVSQSLSGARAASEHEPVLKVSNLEQLVDMQGARGEPDANDSHIIRLVDWLLQFAFEQRASDIHLEPRREDGNIRFRIDGVMHLVHQVPTVILAAMVSRLKALGRMDVIERRRPQDGRVRTRPPQGHEIELRLSTMPTTFGEKLVARIFDPDVLVRSMSELGLAGPELSQWETLTGAPNGMLIVTGPTGSGKTTTLYSALRSLARPQLNVCTIEDPIELVDPALNQMAVQPSIGVDFATGIRTLLRQDPDIIMVGEIRDTETAETALQAAMTGHLVLSTLHTNDAPSSVTRLLDLGIQPFLLASLLGVVAQRLVRTLCDRCKQPVEQDPDEWRVLTAPYQVRVPSVTYQPTGCDECRHTGYKGRIGIFEIMQMNDGLRELLGGPCDDASIRERAQADGMRPLRLSGALKVQAGLTSASEVLGVAPAPRD